MDYIEKLNLQTDKVEEIEELEKHIIINSEPFSVDEYIGHDRDFLALDGDYVDGFNQLKETNGLGISCLVSKEVKEARKDVNGNIHEKLKDRIDSEVNGIKSSLDNMKIEKDKTCYILISSGDYIVDEERLRNLLQETNITVVLYGEFVLSKELDIKNGTTLTTTTYAKISTNNLINVYDNCNITNLSLDKLSWETTEFFITLIGKNHTIKNNYIRSKRCIVAPNSISGSVIYNNRLEIMDFNGYGIQLVSPSNCVIDNNNILFDLKGTTWGSWGISLEIGADSNKIVNNTITGRNKNLTVGIILFNGRGSKCIKNIVCSNNIIENNIITGVTDEGISIDYVLDGKSENYNKVGKFIEGTIDGKFVETSGNYRTIVTCNNLKNLFSDGELNGYMCLITTGNGGGQFSTIDASFKAGGNFYLNKHLFSPVSVGDRFLIGDFALGNIIRKNKIEIAGRTGIAIYGASAFNTIADNTVISCGLRVNDIDTTYNHAGIGCYSITYSGNPFDSLPKTFAPNLYNKIESNCIIGCKLGLEIKDTTYSSQGSLGKPTGTIIKNNVFIGNETNYTLDITNPNSDIQ